MGRRKMIEPNGAAIFARFGVALAAAIEAGKFDHRFLRGFGAAKPRGATATRAAVGAAAPVTRQVRRQMERLRRKGRAN